MCCRAACISCSPNNTYFPKPCARESRIVFMSTIVCNGIAAWTATIWSTQTLSQKPLFSQPERVARACVHKTSMCMMYVSVFRCECYCYCCCYTSLAKEKQPVNREKEEKKIYTDAEANTTLFYASVQLRSLSWLFVASGGIEGNRTPTITRRVDSIVGCFYLPVTFVIHCVYTWFGVNFFRVSCSWFRTQTTKENVCIQVCLQL